jgi:hypothetical protein
LKSDAGGISRQLRAWVDSLQNSEIKGQRYLNEKERSVARNEKEKAEFIVSHNQSSTIDIAVEKDAASMSIEILHALNALNAPARDAVKIRQAIRCIRKIQKKTVSSSIDVEMNIRYLMRTIQYVRMVRGVDTREVLLMLDRLLLSFEGMYYYYEKMK